MDPKVKEWFEHKVNVNPDYIRTHFLPALERQRSKEELELRQVERKGTIEEIKYQIGRLDGVQDILGLFSGLKLSESKAPSGHGLIARTLGFFR